MYTKSKYLSSGKWLSRPRIVCGIMSGTSVDGVDTALAKFYQTEDNKHKMDIMGFHYEPYSKATRNLILDIIAEKITISQVSQLHFILSEIYANAVTALCSKAKLNINKIDLIGMHGQTVWHDPAEDKKTPVRSTLQLGSAPALAAKLNVPVVSDFRAADIALGGQGAPLVTIFDEVFIREEGVDIITLNIGGISNVTFLSADGKTISAFDTGPGNVLIDIFVKKYFYMDYDKNGKIASNGELIPELFESLKEIEFIRKTPPKSTGREFFNKQMVEEKIESLGIKDFNSEDIIHTITRFTAWSIAENIRLFGNENSKIIVSGGGANNLCLIRYLNRDLPNADFISSSGLGIKTETKEALAFAYLAYRNIGGLPGNVPMATGASRPAILGSITYPL
jgi:anhydro-N-acetylmuramic acid kinase